MFIRDGFELQKELISKDLLDFLDRYLRMRARTANTLKEYGISNKSLGAVGSDGQVSNAWSCYGDTGMEVILEQLLPAISEIVRNPLVPTYSYTRVYDTGSYLPRHIDRSSCKLSCTVNIGGDPWPFWIKDLRGYTHKYTLSPGEGLVYRGDILEHWREPFEGLKCSQVFLHYNNKNDPHSSIYDRRDALGMPAVESKIINEAEEKTS